MEECSVTADATASGGGSGGSTGGSSGGGGYTTAPTVQSVTPANNATGIAVLDNITVTFSEAMQSSTIDNTTIAHGIYFEKQFPVLFSYVSIKKSVFYKKIS